MPRHLLAAIAATGCFLVAGAARAADAPKPLRVLVYDVAYSTSTLRHEQTSGFTSSPNGTMGSIAGSGSVDRRFGSDDSGRLTVAVIAATADGGLVVDVSYAGKSTSQPVVRVAILRNGDLSFDPKTPLLGAATGLLPFLSRGLIAERNVNPGSSWIVQAAAPATGATTYRVVTLEGERATLELDSSITVKGASGFAEATQGKAVYATDVLSPLSLDLHSIIRRDVSVEQADTIDARLVATVVSDTFAKR